MTMSECKFAHAFRLLYFDGRIRSCQQVLLQERRSDGSLERQSRKRNTSHTPTFVSDPEFKSHFQPHSIPLSQPRLAVVACFPWWIQHKCGLPRARCWWPKAAVTRATFISTWVGFRALPWVHLVRWANRRYHNAGATEDLAQLGIFMLVMYRLFSAALLVVCVAKIFKRWWILLFAYLQICLVHWEGALAQAQRVQILIR